MKSGSKESGPFEHRWNNHWNFTFQRVFEKETQGRRVSFEQANNCDVH